MRQHNDLIRRARLARRSPSGSGRMLSRQGLAEAVNAHLYGTTRRVFGLDGSYMGMLERGETRWPNAAYRAARCSARRPVETGGQLRTAAGVGGRR